MENRDKYKPLLEKVLKKLEEERAGRSAPATGAQAAGANVQLDTRSGVDVISSIHSRNLHEREGISAADREKLARVFAVAQVQKLDQLARRLGVAVVASGETAPSAAPRQRPLARPKPAIGRQDAFPLELEAANDRDASAPGVSEAEANEMLDALPAMFHRREVAPAVTERRIGTKIALGLPGAALLGAAGVFYLLPDPQPAADEPSAKRFATAHVDLGRLPASLMPTQKRDRETGPTQSDAVPVAAPVAAPPAPEQPAPVVAAAVAAPQAAEATLDDLASAVASDETAAPEAGGSAVTTAQAEPGSMGAAVSAEAGGDRMKQLTDEVVDALSQLDEGEAAAEGGLDQSVDRLRDSLANLVQEAEAQGKDRGSIERLVKEAVGDKGGKLPAALQNEKGELDIQTMIASVVRNAGKAGAASGGDSDYLAMIAAEGGRTVVTRRRVEQEGKQRFFVVKDGDTLSSIAYAIYGDAFHYPKIFRANRQVLKTPDDLAVGQRLVIPD